MRRKTAFSGFFMGGIVMIITKDAGKEYPETASLASVMQELQPDYPAKIVAAKLNGIVAGLQMPVGKYQSIEPIGMDSDTGRRIYRRSVIFLLVMAVFEVEPEAEVIVRFSASNGIYCEIQRTRERVVDEAFVAAIAAHMREIVAEDRPILKKSFPREKAVQMFLAVNHPEKARLISALEQEMVSIYYCAKYYDYLYGAMLATTGELGKFALDSYGAGVLLRTPIGAKYDEVPPLKKQPKLAGIFTESKRWAEILSCDYVTDLNQYNRHVEISDIIRISEALHEKRIAEIADHIVSHDNIRLVLIAGPSSSGKTSFAQRLRIQLCVNGVRPVSISLDDYFNNREKTPKNERGEYDFEALEAVDVRLFNEHLVRLLSGDSVVTPRYNFLTGKREWTSHQSIHVGAHQPIIVEGIHGLNERLTGAIPREMKYKIYVSALTQLNIDAHNRIPTTDARFLRRLVRDYRTRGASALKTFRQWPDVRAGEEKNIFPYQEEADAMFNSALIYELGMLKKHAVPLLENISPDVPEYARAMRMLDFCKYFDDIEAEEDVPNNSILREFIGKSCFFKE